jgi:UDPglucose--hexose-1-phosphate uridylyltransferase
MLSFEKQTIQARMVLPDRQTAARPIEVRRNPITGRTCRITISRSEEREPGASALPNPPPFAAGAPTARSARVRSRLAPQNSHPR